MFLAECVITGYILLTVVVVSGVDELTYPVFSHIHMYAISAGGSMAVKIGLVFEGRPRISQATRNDYFSFFFSTSLSIFPPFHVQLLWV